VTELERFADEVGVGRVDEAADEDDEEDREEEVRA
jgi:hypothetical protein